MENKPSMTGVWTRLRKSVEEQKGVPERSGDDGVGDCPKEGKEEADTAHTEKKLVPGCYGEYNLKLYFCLSCEVEAECRETFGKLQNKAEFLKAVSFLQGLAEPEPAWNPEEERLKQPKSETIEQMWQHVAYYLGSIRHEGMRKVDEEIRERVEQILGGR